MNPKAIAMTIAGSDSSGGAGIQADLKTFAALGVYGTSALTAITAQNTVQVTDSLELPPELVKAQIDAVIQDIKIDAVKTGMLSNAKIIEAVASKIRQYKITNLVVDPVMVAKSGDILLREDAITVLKESLFSIALIVTPNIYEAEVLTGITIKSETDAIRAIKQIISEGAKNVLLKGGHLNGPAKDIFYDGQHFFEFSADRIITKNTHGTGCTLASAITAELAKGQSLYKSIDKAKQYVTEGIRFSFDLGHGHGPLNHFYQSEQ